MKNKLDKKDNQLIELNNQNKKLIEELRLVKLVYQDLTDEILKIKMELIKEKEFSKMYLDEYNKGRNY